MSRIIKQSMILINKNRETLFGSPGAPPSLGVKGVPIMNAPLS